VAVAEREECALHATDERLAHLGLAVRLDTAATPVQRLAPFRSARREKRLDPWDSLMKISLHLPGAES